MDAAYRFTILGCGASPGVPRIGGDWGACDPNNPRNRRRRCSLLAERISGTARTRILVDTSPDLRDQALSAGISTIDGVLYTHAHADHIHGIDDLRSFVLNMRRRVDVHADEPTTARLREAFGYCFDTPEGSDYPPILVGHTIRPGVPVVIEGQGGPLAALPVRHVHGRIDALGFRFGALAYSPDLSGMDAEAEAQMQGLDVWIVDALRRTPHPSHFTLDQALAWIERLKPKRAILTNMTGELDYESLRGSLPPGAEPAYDGMVVELPG